MAIQFGTVDGLVNITKEPILCFVKGINAFIEQGGIIATKSENISVGTAFQRFVDPVYNNSEEVFLIESIKQPVYTSGGSEQSPARVTYCKKMGLLKVDEKNDLFELTPLGNAILHEEITIQEYAFILLSKMGVFKDGVYKDNVFNVIASYFQTNPVIISKVLLEAHLKQKFNDQSVIKTRIDIILNAISFAGLITKLRDDNYILTNIGCSLLFLDYYKNSFLLCPALIDTDSNYSNYIGVLNHGIFDVMTADNAYIYTKHFPNLQKYIKNSNNINNMFNLQQIFYGAPGTGKSYTIKRDVDEKGESCIRTTFHPDSDYSTFVGAYKPTMDRLQIFDDAGMAMTINDQKLHKDQIVYKFVKQSFLKAYIQAWKYYIITSDSNEPKRQYLIIEEINRGNCAQIFGDLFQLLDRNKQGFSEYPIISDEDICKCLLCEDKKEDPSFGKDGLLFSETQKKKINALYNKEGEGRDFANEIAHGKILVLPPNLFIWATMNTSDQSLFPIDSAFKRRWNWQYMKIAEGKDNNNNPYKWKILVEDVDQDRVRLYDWWNFIKIINKKIYNATQSADKQMGYFFTKANEQFSGRKVGVINKAGKLADIIPSASIINDFITAESFVNKVLFYLWTDILKDNEYDEIVSLMKRDNDENMTFSDFFGETGEEVNHEAVRTFLNNVMKDYDEWCDVAEWELEKDTNTALDVNTWFKPKSVIFKIIEDIKDPNDLYERIKGDWVLSSQRANKENTEYVYAYVSPVKKIMACYKVHEWSLASTSGKITRYKFEGEADNSDPMIGQPVDSLAHTPGAVVFYTDNLIQPVTIVNDVMNLSTDQE